MVNVLTDSEQRELKRSTTVIMTVVIIVALLGFWVGTSFLKENVFKNYYNPSRHTIVERDPDSGEVYAWQDALGNVYTTDNPHVTYFPYGTMVLLLLLMLAATLGFSLAQEHYTIMLYLRHQVAGQS